MIASTSTTYAEATSYADISEIEALLSNQKEKDKFINLDISFKEMLAEIQSKAIDGFYIYSGSKTNAQQILNFPRDGNTEIPQAVRFALALLCLDYANTIADTSTSTSSGASSVASTNQQIQSEQIGGDLKITYFKSGGENAPITQTIDTPFAKLAKDLLKPYSTNRVKINGIR